MSEALFALKPLPDNTTTEKAVKKVDDSGHTDLLVKHMETEEKESNVTS